MLDKLATAVRLRESGEHEEARRLLVELSAAYPHDPRVQFQTAWVHDALGREREAVPFYEQALELGLAGAERSGALLGLGSTWRTLGEYEKATATLRQGVQEFPEMRAMEVFLAMSLYNQGIYHEAMQRLLRVIVDTADDESIYAYERAIDFYAGNLDETWQ
jgi:hypothetical protein